MVPIESLKPGDFVICHDRKPHRIIQVIRKPYNGIIIGIRHRYSNKSLWITENHRVLCRIRTNSYGAQRDWSHVPRVHFKLARVLRQQMTSAEKKLWSALRSNQLGVKFRRQHPIGHFIVDFYCSEKGMVIEADGDSHYQENAEYYDQERDNDLISHGLSVLRFTNREIQYDLDGVLSRIQKELDITMPAEDHYKQWRQAGSLKIGDIMYSGSQLQPVKITDIVEGETEEEVLDLEVEEACSFITEVCVVTAELLNHSDRFK